MDITNAHYIAIDIGNKFSEDAFLNQRTDSGASHLSGNRHEQVITSAYFTNAKQEDSATASKSNSSYGNKSIHEQTKSASTASSFQNPDPKSAFQKRTVTSNRQASRHARGHQDTPSNHSSAYSNRQQQPNRTNSYGSAPTVALVTTPEPLEDVLDKLLEINERYLSCRYRNVVFWYFEVSDNPIPTRLSF